LNLRSSRRSRQYTKLDEPIQRGDLYWVDWSPGRGSEQIGTRPALVVQNDAANANTRYPNTVVVTISTKGHPVPSHVEIQPSVLNGLREPSFLKCEQLLTVSKQRLSSKIGCIAEIDLDRVATALRITLAL
jgi:mRNA interferase MazF